MTKPLLITDAVDENLKLVRDADGTDTSIQLSKDKLKVSGDLNVTGNIKTPNQSTPLSDFDLATKKYVDDNAGGSTVQYYYETKVIGYFTNSSSAVYIPLTGYVIEGTSNVGGNERLGMVAPFNGTLERVMWRSESSHNGTLEIDIVEASDGTELPGTTIGTKDTATGSIADDITVEVNFDSMTSGTNVFTKGRIYNIKIDTAQPSGSLDTNVTLVFKWDITT